MLASNGFHHLEKIHISIDPVSARNPGYCFVDFPDRDTANRALTSLSAILDGRPVKVGPCEPKKQLNLNSSGEGNFAYKRWGDWTSQSSNNANTIDLWNEKGVKQGPRRALEHFDDMVGNYKGRRLYVGGLGKMINQAQHNAEVSEIFADFTPYV